jgi:V/A-type H+-transporting ATPase subunit B
MYTDLAMLYERAGIVKGKKGSITQFPILTMPGDDITHPIPDLSGYITEGQIVISRELHQQGIYPPINVLPSLSRLMGSCIGAETTREDHKSVSDQMYAAYAQGRELRGLVAIVGEDALNERDKQLLDFSGVFEDRFLRQSRDEDRSIDETLDLCWTLMSSIDTKYLVRLDQKWIEKYHPDNRE